MYRTGTRLKQARWASGQSKPEVDQARPESKNRAHLIFGLHLSSHLAPAWTRSSCPIYLYFYFLVFSPRPRGPFGHLLSSDSFSYLWHERKGCNFGGLRRPLRASLIWWAPILPPSRSSLSLVPPGSPSSSATLASPSSSPRGIISSLR